MKYFAALLTPALIFLAVACGSADDDVPTATATTPPEATATAAPSGTPDATATTAPASPSPEPTAPPAPSPTPLNNGSNEPFAFAPDPDPATEAATLIDARTAAHDGFDRIVFEFEGVRPEGLVQYVEDAAHCGTGDPVTGLDGDTILSIGFEMTNGHTEAGEPTLDDHELDGPGNTIAEARMTCDFEAQVNWVIGVEGGERPFGVYLLESPSRVVIDIYAP